MNFIDNIKNLFGMNNQHLENKNIASPVPQNEQLTNPALLNWHANQISREALAHAQNQQRPINNYISPTPTQMPAVVNNALLQHIQKGLAGTPAATLSAQFAQAGQGLADPYLPAVLARKETGGGKRMSDKNNLLNILYGGIGHSPYDSPEQNIVGGNGKKGWMGLMHGGLYDKYLNSGDLNDFFKVYTPHVDNNGKPINGGYPEQISQYNAIRKSFE